MMDRTGLIDGLIAGRCIHIAGRCIHSIGRVSDGPADDSSSRVMAGDDELGLEGRHTAEMMKGGGAPRLDRASWIPGDHVSW